MTDSFLEMCRSLLYKLLTSVTNGDTIVVLFAETKTTSINVMSKSSKLGNR